MQLDIKKAFLSPFSEEKWYIKLIFPAFMAIFSLISNILAQEHKAEVLGLALITLLPFLVLYGFFAQFAHNEIHDELPLLPDLKTKVKQYFKYGLSLLGIILIYTIAFFIISFVISLILGFALGFTVAVLKLSKIIIPIVLAILLIPVLILTIAYMTLVEGSFVDNFNFNEALNFKKIYSLIFKVKSEIFVYIILAFGLTIVLSIITIILAVPKITLILVPIVIAIQQLISINLKAQVYKIAKSRLEQPQEI